MASLLEVGPLRHNRCRHRIVASNTHTHQHPKHEYPDHLQSRCGNTVGETDDQYRANNTNDEFLAVHKFASECVAKIAEQQLSKDITNVRACIDKSAKARRVVGFFMLETTPVSIRLISCQGARRFDIPEAVAYSYCHTGVTRLMIKRSYESRKKPTLPHC